VRRGQPAPRHARRRAHQPPATAQPTAPQPPRQVQHAQDQQPRTTQLETAHTTAPRSPVSLPPQRAQGANHGMSLRRRAHHRLTAQERQAAIKARPGQTLARGDVPRRRLLAIHPSYPRAVHPA
jgi:hypothetical protein